LIVKKLNESYSELDDDLKILQEIHNYLKVQREGAYFEHLVKAGFKSPYDFFSVPKDKKLIVLNGHLELLAGKFGIKYEPEISDFSSSELDEFLNSVRTILPFKPHDFQELAFRESILNVKQVNKMATGSGKSLTISLIAEFFRRKNKKGLLLVPNINLLVQFKNDIKDYNLNDLYENTHVIGGGNSEKHFDKSLTISTWQSLLNFRTELDELDYVITDECHRFASAETSDIVSSTVNCKYKWGFTGSLPENLSMKMQLIGLFGFPKTYITSSELIQRGLGTPIRINTLIFNYSNNDKAIFKGTKNYTEKLKFVKDHEKRNSFIVNLSSKLRNKGNSLILFQHTEHGKSLYIDIMNNLFPDVQIENKNITGKKSYEFQEQYGVYFLNGEDDAVTRERTRKVLEGHDNALLVANYALLSTGANIKKLHNLVFASPLKSYTTITQSLGRGMRLHESKTEFVVYDLVDNFSFKKPGEIFYKQYQHRKKTSYNPEEYPINEVNFNLF
jgi:superfamily II DNA or RNA helicase